MSYKRILSAYINKNDKGEYLSIKNNADEDIVIPAGRAIYLNKTPDSVLEQNPKVPLFSKSVKIEEQDTTQASEENIDIPF